MNIWWGRLSTKLDDTVKGTPLLSNREQRFKLDKQQYQYKQATEYDYKWYTFRLFFLKHSLIAKQINWL